jgi:uncharacterized membrane protein YfcA
MQQKGSYMTSQLIPLILVIGLGAGILSGLIGVGGGIILVPALVYFLSYSQHQAQGTSLGVLSFPVVILAFLKYFYDLKGTGEAIDFKVILLLGVGFLLGGFITASHSVGHHVHRSSVVFFSLRQLPLFIGNRGGKFIDLVINVILSCFV